MSKFPLLCLCLLSSSFLFGQYDDLLKNPDISWVAEYTADFTLDPSTYYWYESEPENDLIVIHLLDLPGSSGLCEPRSLERYFSQKIFAALKEGGFLMYEDEALEIPLSKEKLAQRLSKMDTVAKEPQSYDDTDWGIVQTNLTHGEIVFFKIRQVFFYHKTEKKFDTRILAIAPVLGQEDESGNVIGHKPLAWLKIGNPPKNWDKAMPQDFPYAVETKMRGNAPYFGNFVLKKGRMDFLSLIVSEIAKPSHLFLDKDFVPIDPSKLQEFVLSVDTVRTFNPETYAEKTEIVERNALKDVEQISFVQQWFFDDRKRIFFNRVTAVAPLVAVKDEEGNFLYSKVLFYMLNK